MMVNRIQFLEEARVKLFVLVINIFIHEGCYGNRILFAANPTAKDANSLPA